MNKPIAAALFLPAAITMPSIAFGDLHPMALEGDFNSPNALWRLGDGRMAFRARTAETGSEMWVTDGTAGGTSVVDLVPGTYGGRRRNPPPSRGDIC